jgi:hypothetical protein
MNLAEINDEEDEQRKIIMMDTYDRLLRLRTVLEHDIFQPKEIPPLVNDIKKLKSEYLDLLEEILIGYSSLEPKKERANTILTMFERFGDKNMKYVEQMKELVEQFDKDECITEIAEELKIKTERLLGMKKVFELCSECDIMSKYMCFLCLDRTVQVLVDPCGHVICDECSKRNLSSCPFCRGRIHQFKRMFIDN